MENSFLKFGVVNFAILMTCHDSDSFPIIKQEAKDRMNCQTVRGQNKLKPELEMTIVSHGKILKLMMKILKNYLLNNFGSIFIKLNIC